MRVIEAVELVACHVFTHAEQTRQRLTFGDVERHLAQLAGHPRLHMWSLWAAVEGERTARVCDRVGLAAADTSDQGQALR